MRLGVPKLGERTAGPWTPFGDNISEMPMRHSMLLPKRIWTPRIGTVSLLRCKTGLVTKATNHYAIGL